MTTGRSAGITAFERGLRPRNLSWGRLGGAVEAPFEDLAAP
jgi:hypothetical protein